MASWLCSRPKLIAILAIMLLLIPHALFLLQPIFVDERAVLTNVLKFANELTLIPTHTRYPTFFSYIAAPFIGLGAFLHSVFGGSGDIKESVAFAYYLEGRTLVMPARLLSLAALTGAIVFLGVYLSRRFGRPAGYTAGAAALATPALLSYGSYALPDALVLVLCAVSLILALRFLETYPHRPARNYLLLSAFVSGLAISTKYNAFASVIPIGAACIILLVSGKTDFLGMIRMTVLSAIVCIGAFLLGSPAWIIAPELMLDGLHFEMEHAKAGHLGTSGIPLLGHVELLVRGSPWEKGMPVLFIGSLPGIAVCIRNKTSHAVLPAALIAATMGLGAFSAKQSLQYLYPMVGGLCYFWAAGISHLEARSKTLSAVVPMLFIAVIYAASFENGLRYLRPNATEIAADWMYRNIPEGSSIAVDAGHVPSIFSEEALRKLEVSAVGKLSRRIVAHIRTNYRLYDVVPLERSTEWLKQSRAEYFVTSDLASSRFFELGIFTGIEPDIQTALGVKFHRVRAFYKELFASRGWDKVFLVDTGNGPKTVIYKRI